MCWKSNRYSESDTFLQTHALASVNATARMPKKPRVCTFAELVPNRQKLKHLQFYFTNGLPSFPYLAHNMLRFERIEIKLDIMTNLKKTTDVFISPVLPSFAASLGTESASLSRFAGDAHEHSWNFWHFSCLFHSHISLITSHLQVLRPNRSYFSDPLSSQTCLAYGVQANSDWKKWP